MAGNFRSIDGDGTTRANVSEVEKELLSLLRERADSCHLFILRFYSHDPQLPNSGKSKRYKKAPQWALHFRSGSRANKCYLCIPLGEKSSKLLYTLTRPRVLYDSMCWMKDWWDARLEAAGYPFWLSYVPKVLLAVVIALMDEAYFKVAVWLNDIGTFYASPYCQTFRVMGNLLFRREHAAFNTVCRIYFYNLCASFSIYFTLIFSNGLNAALIV